MVKGMQFSPCCCSGRHPKLQLRLITSSVMRLEQCHALIDPSHPQCRQTLTYLVCDGAYVSRHAERSNPTTWRPKGHHEGTCNRLMLAPYTSFSTTLCADNKRSLSQEPISCTFHCQPLGSWSKLWPMTLLYSLEWRNWIYLVSRILWSQEPFLRLVILHAWQLMMRTANISATFRLLNSSS
jgi:hypothetical protein